MLLAVRRSACGRPGAVFRAVPSSFVPDEDEGYFITIVQAPAGASLEYTTNIAKQAEQICFKRAGDRRRRSRSLGFSFSGAAPNNGLMFARLKDFDEREGAEQSLSAVLEPAARPAVRHSRARSSLPFPPPSIQGLSAFGGFQFEVLDQTGGDINELAGGDAAADRRAAIRSGRVAGLFTQLPRRRSAARRRRSIATRRAASACRSAR